MYQMDHNTVVEKQPPRLSFEDGESSPGWKGYKVSREYINQIFSLRTSMIRFETSCSECVMASPDQEEGSLRITSWMVGKRVYVPKVSMSGLGRAGVVIEAAHDGVVQPGKESASRAQGFGG